MGFRAVVACFDVLIVIGLTLFIIDITQTKNAIRRVI